MSWNSSDSSVRLLGLTAPGAAGAAVALLVGPALGGSAPSPATTAVAAGLVAVALVASRVARRGAAERARQETAWALARRRTAAHEIRGPLAVALGHVDLVAEDPTLTHDQRTSLAAGARSVRRALELVNELVVVSPDVRELHDHGPGLHDPGIHDHVDGRPAPAGQDGQDRAARASATTVDLAAVVREAVADVAPLAARRRVAISLDATGPAPVRGDASRLRQVVDNLLSNAVKYATDAGWVDVLVARTEADAVLLQLTNAGTTLTPDEAQHAFEVEFRAAAAASSSTPGTGIGLAVVHEVVTGHAGTVELTSDPECGTTTVAVRLPAAATAELTGS